MKKAIFTVAAIIVIITVSVVAFYIINNSKTYDGITLSNSKDISEALRNVMLKRVYSLQIIFQAKTLDETEIEEQIDSLMLGALYDSENPKARDYLKYQYGGYELRHKEEKKWFKYDYNVHIIPKYYTDAKQEEWVDKKVADILFQMESENLTSDYEKVKWVIDFICREVNYDKVHRRNTGSSHIQSTAYGALFYHSALCQGYSVLCYRLLKEMDIDVRVITGYAQLDGNMEKHAWNIVKLDDKYYNIDVTFMDILGDENSDDYFLKSDSTFEKDHRRDAEFMTEDFCKKYPMSEKDIVDK